MDGPSDRGVSESLGDDRAETAAYLKNIVNTGKRQMARKQRVDSNAAAVKIMQGQPILQPPSHISVPESAMPFWTAIIRARTHAEWEAAPSLMNAAANLAWTQWRIDQTRRQIDGEVAVDEGTTVAQLGSLLLKMQRLEMGYLRVLQQHGRAVEGEARDIAKRRSQTNSIKTDLGDDLLAKPASIQ